MSCTHAVLGLLSSQGYVSPPVSGKTFWGGETGRGGTGHGEDCPRVQLDLAGGTRKMANFVAESYPPTHTPQIMEPYMDLLNSRWRSKEAHWCHFTKDKGGNVPLPQEGCLGPL